ncbi:MAG: histidine phosphatase family protein [Verrucomicrobiota bacterium]
MSEPPHPGSLTVLLFRHPQTDWNTERRYQGRTDRPWSPQGQERADHLASTPTLPSFDHIIHSPRGHARRLAESLASGTTPLLEDDRWAEIDHGNWEGLTYNEVSERFPDSCKERFADPLNCESHGGETLSVLHTRVLSAWNDLPQQADGPTVALVTHATPIQVVLCHLTGLPVERHWQFRIDCGSITSLEITSGGTIINYCNRL